MSGFFRKLRELKLGQIMMQIMERRINIALASSFLPVVYIMHNNQNEVVARLDKLELERTMRERADQEALRDAIRKMELGSNESHSENLFNLKRII